MRKPRRSLLGRLFWLGTACLAAGCPATAEQVAPPQFDLYFPTGLAVSPDEKYLFAITANSDLLYSVGAIQVLDLDAVDQLADGWRDTALADRQPPADCYPIPTRPSVLSCPTSVGGAPRYGLLGDAGVQIGNFGVTLAVEPLRNGDGTASTQMRLFATVRGDPSITYADFDSANPVLQCGGDGTFGRCDEAHRLARFRDDADLPGLASEPFGVAVDPVGQHAFVSHLTSGVVTLVAAPDQVGSRPVLTDQMSGFLLWGVSLLDGTIGAVGVAPRLPGDATGLVYVTSRSEARVSMVFAVDNGVDSQGLPIASLGRTGSFFFDGLASNGSPGDARNITFSPDGNRAFIVSRTPPSVQIFDTSLDASGAPRNLPLGVVEICEQPSNLSLVDFGEGLRAVVPCFGVGRVWIVDVDNLSVIAVEDTGRGPSGIATSAARKKIYIGNYAEDTLTVIDAKPGSQSQYRSILRLGTPRVVKH